MSYRPLSLVLTIAGLSPALACAQTGNPIVNPALPSPSKTANAPQTDALTSLTPEMRGDIFMARKQYREAIDIYAATAKKDPVLWNKTGIAYHQLVELDQARKAYQQAVKLRPDYMEAINNLGTVYYAQKSYRRAISYYQRAIKLAPDDPKAASIYMNLGTAFFARKQYEQCALANQKAIELDPEVFERHGNYGIMLEERNVEERAKYHYYIAKMYAKSGRNELAIQYLRKALEEGFKEKDKLTKDPEFATLRDMPEFKQLLTTEQRVL
ncbi:MAG TPA: tetratricopeptide repeat protein [Verrucomicrobiae bacterium]|nr:tetratricopeptide repeat protein [Verrucomicrobiae bacterium]